MLPYWAPAHWLGSLEVSNNINNVVAKNKVPMREPYFLKHTSVCREAKASEGGINKGNDSP